MNYIHLADLDFLHQQATLNLDGIMHLSINKFVLKVPGGSGGNVLLLVKQVKTARWREMQNDCVGIGPPLRVSSLIYDLFITDLALS